MPETIDLPPLRVKSGSIVKTPISDRHQRNFFLVFTGKLRNAEFMSAT